MGKILGFVREKNEEFEGEAEEEGAFVTLNNMSECQDEEDEREVIEAAFQSSWDEEPWLLVSKAHSPSPSPSPSPSKSSRVRLCAAHTTFNLDAEAAILEMKDFMAAVFRDEVPNKHVEQAPRGEERWLWDYALEQEWEMEYKYSVLAPLSIVEEGRRTIPREQWSVA